MGKKPEISTFPGRIVAIESAVSRMIELLKFSSPNSHDQRVALMELFGAMVSKDDNVAEGQCEWLVKILTTQFDEWPGPRTVRGIFCRRWKPVDGIEAGLAEPLAQQISQATSELQEHAQRKQLGAGKSVALLPAVEPVVDWAAVNRREVQNADWQRLCELIPRLERAERELSREFWRTEDLERRAEIIREVEEKVRKETVTK